MLSLSEREPSFCSLSVESRARQESRAVQRPRPMPLGVSPKVWGPSGWRLLHGFAHAAADAPTPEEARARRARYRALVGALSAVLPCPACRENVAGHLKVMRFPRNAAGLPRWAFRLHHRVNGTQVSREGPTYEAVAERYAPGAREPFRPAEALPFMEAVVATHPGGRAATPEYIAALQVFIGALGPAPDGFVVFSSLPRRSDLESRMALKRWLSEQKRSLGAADAAPPAAPVATTCRLGDPHSCGGPLT